MHSRVEILRPALASAPLLRDLAGTRVYRLAEAGGYFIDWVEFRGGNVTPVHDHPGIEHHLVARGRVACRYEERLDLLDAGDFVFWDGRKRHTSYAADDRDASMLIVRATNCRAPDADHVLVSRGNQVRFDDGVGCASIMLRNDAAPDFNGGLLVAVATSPVTLLIAGEDHRLDAAHPLLVVHGQRHAMAVRAKELDANVAFLDFAI